MTIQPEEELSLDLRGLLAGLWADVSGDFSDGSLAVYFKGGATMLGGQLTMTNTARSLALGSVVADSSPGRTSAPGSLNGVWWGLGGGRDALIRVANTSLAPVSADVFLDFQGKRHPSASLNFAPFETKVLSATDLLGALDVSPAQAPEGGISIVSRGGAPSLVAHGTVADATGGRSGPK